MTAIIAPGLPNIAGTVTNTSFYNAVANAPFSLSNGNGAGGAENTGTKKNLTFNASTANSIYGNSETVQPPTLQLIPQIKF